jgi:metal-responsive CopG/Arc/MetJ family transcriptional regulator
MRKILVSFPEGVFETVRSLKGELGESDSELVRNIVIAYLSEQGFFSQTSVRGIASQRRMKANEKRQQE